MNPKCLPNNLKIQEKSTLKPDFSFFCKTLILVYPPVVLHDFLVLGGPVIDKKSIKIKT